MTYLNPGVYTVETPLVNNVTRASTSQSIATFIGTSTRGPITASLINSWTGYKSLYGDISSDHEMGYSVYHYFANGGRDAYIVRVSASDAVASSVSVPYYPNGESGASAALMTATANSPGVWGNSVSLLISSGSTSPTASVIPTFNLSIRVNGSEVERWNELSTDPNNNRYAATVVNTYSKYISITVPSSTADADWLFDFNSITLTGGADGSSVGDSDYVSALSSLDVIEGALLINAPGQTSSTVVNAFTTKAESRGNSFVIIDPSSETDPVEIGSSVVSTYSPSSYGAVYYPKLKMVDPTKSGPGAIRDTFPGGAIAGVYTRTEVARTVAKAPAGYDTDIRNALALTTNFTSSQTGTLYNTYGVNLLKSVPGGGIIVNGTRTLDKSTPGKYIPIRRSLNYLKQALKDATEFAVYSPNDQRLWEQIAFRCGNVLNEFWKAGGLKGRNPGQAYYVLCNETNNTVETISNGEVRVEVGVALQYPAEFVVITISQWTGGANSVSSL
jgi:hypothetical protein